MRVDPVELDLKALGVGSSSFPRSEGLHMSSLYSSYYQDAEPERYKRDTEPDPLVLEFGLMFENALEAWLAQRIISSRGEEHIERPGEFTTVMGDVPVYYTPDLLIFNGGLRVGEIKLTDMSSRDVPRAPGGSFPDKFSRWATQIKLYCRALETPLARLYALFMYGDYKRPFKRELLAWDLTFSQTELEEEWRIMTNHGKQKGLIP